MPSLFSWQERTVVLDGGVLYFYADANLDENGVYIAPYGQNIRGYFSLRGVKLVSDRENQGPKDIVIKRDNVYNATDSERKSDSDATDQMIEIETGLASIDTEKDVEFRVVGRDEAEILSEFQAHIDYANENNVATPTAGDDVRVKPLLNARNRRFLPESD